MKRNAVNQIICYVLAMLLLGSCQTWGPTWSEVTGVRYTAPSLGVGPVVINQIDGSNPGNAPGQPIKITPGHHTLVLQVIPPGSVAGLVNLEQTVLDAAPCKRYYINGRFAASTSTDWKPFVDYEEQISDCQVPASPK
ncbi:MAG TPA: hypothetical protein VG425_07975 [Casimicrobiaceae bacterium]|jgi:hypothetical protein|nr:hypothetical protein [Casimicrobiaceae bacterium]